MSYVVAFNRDRDFYQLPFALHQAGLLSRLVTDFYYPGQFPLNYLPLRSRLIHRRMPGLPARMATSTPSAIAWQVLGPRLGMSPHRMFRGVASALAKAALRAAERSGANLFLYSECAMEAFAASSAKGMVKGLFMFHPHTALIRHILLRDFEQHPECGWSMATDSDMAQPENQRERLDAEWSHADFIVCASAFTADSLRFAGCDDKEVVVIPYGIDVPEAPFAPECRETEVCRFLFVGQGVQRKGLHHLLKAWRLLRLPHAELTVVAAVLDPGIAALAGPGVRILPRQPRDGLWRHYNASHVFVMPSLVEGFGLVYLEALAAGCYCIGTQNTGLPDLHPSDDQACIVDAGDVEGLAKALEEAYLRHRRGELDAAAIRGFATGRSWSAFRHSVAQLARARLAA